MEMQKCEQCKEYYYGDKCLNCTKPASTDWYQLDIREQ